jgi:hypothetical protein
MSPTLAVAIWAACGFGILVVVLVAMCQSSQRADADSERAAAEIRARHDGHDEVRARRRSRDGAGCK